MYAYICVLHIYIALRKRTITCLRGEKFILEFFAPTRNVVWKVKGLLEYILMYVWTKYKTFLSQIVYHNFIRIYYIYILRLFVSIITIDLSFYIYVRMFVLSHSYEKLSWAILFAIINILFLFLSKFLN